MALISLTAVIANAKVKSDKVSTKSNMIRKVIFGIYTVYLIICEFPIYKVHGIHPENSVSNIRDHESLKQNLIHIRKKRFTD